MNASLKRAEEKKSLFFSELAHGVANNFAAIAALISLKSLSVKDPRARAVLDEAIEQVKVMGRVHGRLRAGDQEALVDSEQFFGELCNDLKASLARGQPVSIECKADSIPMSMDQATSLGLIVNELVTNAIKHAFPHGRPGRIRVAFEAFKDELRLCVEDDGVGFCPRYAKRYGNGARPGIRAGGSTRGPFGSRIDDQRQLIPPVRSVRKSGPVHAIAPASGSKYPLRCGMKVVRLEFGRERDAIASSSVR